MDDIQKKKFKLVKILVTIIIIIILVFIIKEWITNTNSIIRITQSTGIFGPIILILLISLGILFTPISSILFIITAGYLYGLWQGAIYAYIGEWLAAVGTFVAIKIIKIDIKHKSYEKYKKIINGNKKIIYLLYAIPIIPISVLSIMCSSSKMKLKKFLKIITISFIPPVLFFSFFGDKINNQNLTQIGILSLVTIFIFFLGFKIIKKKIHIKIIKNIKSYVKKSE